MATALKDVVKVGAVDADKHQSLRSQYEVQGFPTIKILGSNKNRRLSGWQDFGLHCECCCQCPVPAHQELPWERGYSSVRQGRSESSSKKDVMELTTALVKMFLTVNMFRRC